MTMTDCRMASGLVKRVGSAVTRFTTGDRVFHLSLKPFGTRLRASDALCEHIPEHMTFAEAACIPLAVCTALRSVRDLGRLKAGETILIHDAARAVGQAAIQVAQYLRGDIFATVKSLQERRMLCERYGIPEDHVFTCLDTSFVQEIKQQTNGRGVDVVHNSLEGELLRQTWFCVAPFGRFIDIGSQGLGDGASLDTAPFRRGATFACFDLDLMLNEQPGELGVLLEDATAMIRQGVIRPKLVVKEMTATALFSHDNALEQDEARDSVVTISPEDKIPVHPSALNALRLRKDATYIIVGGLGGLGRSQALRMAEDGAGCIVFLSRSGASDPKAASLCEELESHGTHAVCWSCDVADADQLREALDRCAKELPPIRGCIQGAMVLRDGFVQHLSLSVLLDPGTNANTSQYLRNHDSRRLPHLPPAQGPGHMEPAHAAPAGPRLLRHAQLHLGRDGQPGTSQLRGRKHVHGRARALPQTERAAGH